jgi:hypothetical protein
MLKAYLTTETVAVGAQEINVAYWELRTQRGARRYSAVIQIGPEDCIILDDDSYSNLQARTACLVPATLYSRLIASKPTAA